MEFAKDSSIEVLGELMEEKGVSVSVVDAFAENFIDGPTFLMLTEEDIKSLIPLIGDRARVRMLKNWVELDLQVNPLNSTFGWLNSLRIEFETVSLDTLIYYVHFLAS